MVIRQGDRFKIDIRALMDTGVDVANAVLEVMDPTRAITTGGGKLHRTSGNKIDRASMKKVSVIEDIAESNFGSDDSTVRNLISVVNGKEPRAVEDKVRKRSKQSRVDMGIAMNRFGEKSISCTRPPMRGVGTEPNTCRESNVASIVVAEDSGRIDRTEGCFKAIVSKALIRVMVRMDRNATVEDATAAKKDAVRDGGTCAKKFGDEPNFDTSVSSARLGIALSTHGTVAVTLSSKATSVGSSA